MSRIIMMIARFLSPLLTNFTLSFLKRLKEIDRCSFQVQAENAPTILVNDKDLSGTGADR